MMDLVISYVGRKFTVRLYQGEDILGESECTDASTDLISCIELALNRNPLHKLSKIIFLSGPGSLTGSRIVCATLLGIEAACKIPIIPVRLDEALRLYAKCPVVLSFTSDLAHVFQNDTWSLVEISKLHLDEYITDNPNLELLGNRLPWPDLCKYVKEAGNKVSIPNPIKPFYGALDIVKT